MLDSLISSTLMASTNSRAARESRSLPQVVILATGGTIAGKGASAGRTTDYVAGVLDVDTLISSVPGLGVVARIRCEQVANIDSSHITNDVLLKLARRTSEIVQEEDVAGVVITHGTDTMEETAYFLNLVIPGYKPVVLTGSMRPSTAISADGPLNLLNAATVAATPLAKGKGVLVAMNEHIHAARFVTKTHTTNLDAFQSPEFGAVGHILDGSVEFFIVPTRRHTTDSEFSLIGIEGLPRVDIVFGHGHHTRDIVDAVVRAGAKGIVHAGMGNGMIFPETYQALKEAATEGIIVVRASRVGSGMVSLQKADEVDNMIASGTLNPQKARILLMVALTQTTNQREIRRMFSEY